MKHLVYADNAATTKVSDSVIKVMSQCLSDNYGNPSSLYEIGAKAKEKLEESRNIIANCIGALSREVYFTSGGSESDNWAIKGLAARAKNKGKMHIITSKFEHHAVLHPLEELEKQGFSVTYLDVHSNGLVRPDELEQAIRKDTAFVTIMFANNEIGTIQPVKEIGEICRKHNIIFHTDAVQAIGKVHIDVNELNIDLLSLTAHKIHGPKGVGALYIRKGILLDNLISGGGQESGKRAGTENLTGIVGLTCAMKEAVENIEERAKRLKALTNRLIDGASKIDRSILNGDREKRLPGNFNMCFEGIEGESLLLSLDLKGISASSGSACTSGSLDPSHVLLALGMPHEVAHGSLRLSLSDYNTEEDVDYILEVLPGIIDKLRYMSPLWEKIIKENRPQYKHKD